MEYYQLFYQKMWFDWSCFMQLPHFTVEKIRLLSKKNKKFYNTMFPFLNLTKEDKIALLKNDFTSTEIDEILLSSEFIPVYNVKIECFVDGFDEVIIGDIITIKILIERVNLSSDKVIVLFIF